VKYFLVLLLTVSQMAVAGQCVIRQASQMTSDRKVGEVTDLVKNKNPGSCNVKFRIAVDGELHTVDWTYTGLYQEEVLCRMAIENGTKENDSIAWKIQVRKYYSVRGSTDTKTC
jgi:hypothetical protein